MQKEFITHNSKETRELGKILAKELRGGEIICLAGELGAGKTTFTQGFLEGLGVEGPYTSPTFVIMKKYRVKQSPEHETQNKEGKRHSSLHAPLSMIYDIYHIDAYRVNSDDVLNLGWEEILRDKNNVIIVEWAERIRDIIPQASTWIDFKWLDKNRRKIIFKKIKK